MRNDAGKKKRKTWAKTGQNMAKISLKIRSVQTRRYNLIGNCDISKLTLKMMPSHPCQNNLEKLSNLEDTNNWFEQAVLGRKCIPVYTLSN